MVSPGDPLKEHAPASLERRVAARRGIPGHPRVEVTGLETMIGACLTVDTLGAVVRLFPRTRFVWLMGADNLGGFHGWEGWRTIMDLAPASVLARRRHMLDVLGAPILRMTGDRRLPRTRSRSLWRSATPAWCPANHASITRSSTETRAKGHWPPD